IFPKEPARYPESRIREVKEGNRGVVLDRKVPIRNRNVGSTRNASELRNELPLRPLGTDVLQHRVRRGDVELVIFVWERPVGLNPRVPNLRERRLELRGLAKTTRGNHFLVGVLKLEEICAIRLNVRDPDIEYRALRFRSNNRNEVLINSRSGFLHH